jgi:hypothetical protein
VNTVIGLLIAAAVTYWAASKYLPRLRAWSDARRNMREAARERTEQLLRDAFATADTQPIDVVDGPWDRSDREIHGMTASDLIDLNAKFDDLIGREWPNQT